MTPGDGAGPTTGPRPQAVQVAAPAKVNLRLRILAQESSGYHQLETLFLRLELADTVRVRRTRGARTLDVTGDLNAAALGPVEHNLAWRAADAYAHLRGSNEAFAIEIEKHIPIGGGLGGGSADAGAVLRCLDALSDAPIGEAALMQIAGSLGADVPFLTTTDPYALAWGRGERMLALAPPPARPVMLLVPEFGVNTAEAYRWLAESRGDASSAQSASGMLRIRNLSDWETVAELATNDFEPVVASRHPELVRYVAELRGIGCRIAMMSGSGSTVFGVGSSQDSEFPFGTTRSQLAAPCVI